RRRRGAARPAVGAGRRRGPRRCGDRNPGEPGRPRRLAAGDRQRRRHRHAHGRRPPQQQGALARPLSAKHSAAPVVSYYPTGLRFTARSKGGWGNRIRVVITPLEVTPEGGGGHFTSFSLRIAVDPGPDTSAPVEEEYYNRLSLASDPKDPEYAFNVVERVNR